MSWFDVLKRLYTELRKVSICYAIISPCRGSHSSKRKR